MVQLDESQRAFIEAPVDQNIRLLAPAGCGKTLCLLHRCRHLAEQSSTKQNILIVAFTRAARDELKSRINETPEFAAIRDRTEITTLNSWGYRRIRRSTHRHHLITSQYEFRTTMERLLHPVWQNYDRIKSAIKNSNRRISNTAPQKLMKMIDDVKSLGFDHVRQRTLGKFLLQWHELEQQGLEFQLQGLIDELIKFEILGMPSADEDEQIVSRANEFYDAFYGFWLEATQHLIEHVTFTLDDQKYFAYLDEYSNIENGRLLSGAASSDHVFVDEFQDINPLDLALIRAIVERNRATITIAGDDDQAIFEWRGATPEYILDPSTYFNKKFETFTLEVNYRSPRNIVEHSQLLIANNARRVKKRISAKSEETALIEEHAFSSLNETLEYVHELVTSCIENGSSPGRIVLIGA